MNLLFSVPYLLRIVLSLVSILAFQKLLKRLDLAMIMGIVILGLWTGHDARSLGSVSLERLISPDTIALALVIIGVIWLSSLMSEAGIMRDLVVSLKSRLSRRTLLAALPAVVGLLPMPAGALFSAPLVDDADETGALSPELKTRINYWFRHIWEFWWPLYPGVLLAVDLSGLPIHAFVLPLFPLFIAAIVAGYVFLLRRAPSGPPEPRQKEDKAFLPLILPTLTVIVVYALLLAAWPGLGRMNKYFPMLIGVICGIAMIQFQRPATAATWKKVLLSRRAAGLVLIIVLARIYGAFIEARLPEGRLLMEAVRTELDTFGIPALALVVIIPFVSGLTTGITVGYIGASFPVVLSLAGPGTSGLYSTIIIGYTCGFLGMMLSPIHVCLIVTNEYFKTRLAESIGGLLKPVALLFLIACLYASGWYLLGTPA